jgi:hypothetical protein
VQQTLPRFVNFSLFLFYGSSLFSSCFAGDSRLAFVCFLRVILVLDTGRRLAAARVFRPVRFFRSMREEVRLLRFAMSYPKKRGTRFRSQKPFLGLIFDCQALG